MENLVSLISNENYRMDVDKDHKCLKLTLLSSRLTFADALRFIRHLEVAVLLGGIEFLDIEEYKQC